MKTILLGAVALAAAVPAIAQMQSTAAAPAPMAPMAEMTRDQMVAKVREHFAKMDANRDGFVGADEMKAMREQHMQKMGAKGHPMGGDHKMVQNGMPGAPGKDGGHGEHGGMMKMHDMGGKMGGGMMGGMMKMADLNKDGRVSLQEATTSALQHFDKADSNRDGRITPDERRSMHQKMMQMRAPKAG